MPDKKKHESRDMRRYRKESEKRYLVLVILTLVVVGGGLIALIYGPTSLISALPCLLGGAALILLPMGALYAIEKWRDWMERKIED